MKYPKSEQYDKQFLLENMMGPNALKILEELTEGIKLTSDMKILDLGCGKGLTSIFLAKEFGVQVYATAIGVVLGYVSVKTGRLKYNCILHIMVNSYSTLLLLMMSRKTITISYLLAARAVPVVTLGMIIASIVIFCVNVKKTRLLPGNWPEGIEYRDFSSAMYLNPGTVVFIVLNLLLAGYYLLLA